MSLQKWIRLILHVENGDEEIKNSLPASLFVKLQLIVMFQSVNILFMTVENS